MVKAKQPEINIGLFGHVDHGKTTLTEKLSGKWTDTHSEEIKRGITIRLGYADCTINKCESCGKLTAEKKCCKKNCKLIRSISIVDAPGHESLMATMLSGATIIDGALLLIAANEDCPQPQTREHIMALGITGIKNLIIIQNKVDLVTDEQAIKNYEQIKSFLKGTEFEKAPVIPISAQHSANLDLILENIEKIIPTPKREKNKPPLLLVARSFDVNKPGSDPLKIQGGVLGGALVQGKIKDGETVEIRPGIFVEEQNKKIAKPLTTKIVGLKSGSTSLTEATPGGTLGLLTLLDPSIVKSDSLTGNVVGLPGKLPPIKYDVTLKPYLLERVVGAKEDLEVVPIKLHEALMLNVNSAATVGVVTEISKNKVSCRLKLPLCVDKGARITISRLIGNRFRLIGYGILE
jgi:translation initiation factor 2 subunit 3